MAAFTGVTTAVRGFSAFSTTSGAVKRLQIQQVAHEKALLMLKFTPIKVGVGPKEGQTRGGGPGGRQGAALGDGGGGGGGGDRGPAGLRGLGRHARALRPNMQHCRDEGLHSVPIANRFSCRAYAPPNGTEHFGTAMGGLQGPFAVPPAPNGIGKCHCGWAGRRRG